MRVVLSIALAIHFAAPAVLLAQDEPEPTPPVIQAFGVETSRVLLDVVVRDKNDNPITDLQPEDFEVYEEGVLQTVDIFRVVRPPAQEATLDEVPEQASDAQSTSAPLEVTAAPPPEMAVIAFVFDRLSPESRQLAARAALTYLENGRRASDRVGVFAIDLSLVTLQNYTGNPAAIRVAIQKASGRASSQHASSRQRQRDIGATTRALEQTAAAAAGGGGGSGPGAGAAAGAAGAAAGAAAAEAELLAMEARMHEAFETLERDQQGYATSNGLLAVVNSMRLLPGRKTVVFFSEGLSIPPAVEAHFRSVISEANRANVSIYAMDAAGLRTDSPLAETRREMIAQANQQMSRLATGRDYVGGPMSRQMERNEDLLRFNPHSGLGTLSDETGGFLIRDTNDLETGFEKINADMRFYYELAYEPVDIEYDGSFRDIEVKVKRPGVRVRARKGYYAVRQTDDRPVLPFEAPALALLDSPPPTPAFPTLARSLSFPQAGRPGLTPILVKVPGNALTVTEDTKEKTYLAEFVIMARVKRDDGQVIDRLSQSYHLTGPLEQAKAARAGDVLFYREADLPPGRYTLETVAYDLLAEAGAVQTEPLVVPAAAPGRPHLASVLLVERVEKVGEEGRDPTNPLCFGDVLVYPNLGEPIDKSERREVLFLITVYSALSGPLAPRATLEILKDGATVAEAPTALPEPDASGRIQHVLGLPLAGFSPGSYELRLTVSDDRGRDTRSMTFTVEG